MAHHYYRIITSISSSVSIAGPYFGIAFGLKGLGVIVLGGLGSIPGAVRDLRINKLPSRLEKQLVTPTLNYGN
ncbi:MAG: hypothetical protein RLZZ148_2371 [Cyanobacteriota bacterium]|jgi:hypothetical protein